MRTLLPALLICLLTPAAAALAQESPPPAAPMAPDNPFSAHSKFVYGAVKNILLRSAENMPEENYNFKPTEAVRSFGQIVGHVADAQSCFVPSYSARKIPPPKSSRPRPRKPT